MNAIEIVNLRKEYKNIVAVHDLNLSIQKGELFALLGVNGAGKTTTITMLTTLTKPTSGKIFINGYNIYSQAKEIKKVISVSPQEIAIAGNLTVLENLEFMCEIHGFSKQKTKDKIRELTHQFNLEQVLNRKASKLSGGWQRKVSIALSLISEPQILFLDEPTLGLDVIARKELWHQIELLKGKMTIILTTHYMEEAKNLSNRIGIMKNGHLITVGSVEQLNKQANTDDFEEAFVSIIKEANV